MLSEEEKKVINRLKLLNKELYLDECNLVNSNDLKMSLNIINRLQKENEKYEYVHQQIINNITKLEETNIQLKKQIDLMAKKINEAYIDESSYWIWFEKSFGIRPENDYSKEIKEYFEKGEKDERK